MRLSVSVFNDNYIHNELIFLLYEHLSDQGGFLGTQDLFFAHFTTFACAFFTIIFSNCLTIGYASFDAKKIKSTPLFSR